MIIAVGASAVVGFSLFTKRRTKQLQSEMPQQFEEPPAYKSLFAPSDEELLNFEREEQTRKEAESLKQRRESLLSRAAANDLTVLKECADDKNLYDEVLNKLANAAESDEKMNALVKFILTNKLHSNSEAVEKFAAIRSKDFNKSSTLDYLEFAARSEKAETYLKALETTAKARRENFAVDFTIEDFARIAEADFRLLPDGERASGAGFLIKEKLAELRRK